MPNDVEFTVLINSKTTGIALANEIFIAPDDYRAMIAALKALLGRHISRFDQGDLLTVARADGSILVPPTPISRLEAIYPRERGSEAVRVH